jgi:hypothetical protein
VEILILILSVASSEHSCGFLKKSDTSFTSLLSYPGIPAPIIHSRKSILGIGLKFLGAGLSLGWNYVKSETLSKKLMLRPTLKHVPGMRSEMIE